MIGGWLILAGAGVVAAGGRAAYLYVKPYKPCGTCGGRGYCIRCDYKGKVLRRGARFVHPELRRK